MAVIGSVLHDRRYAERDSSILVRLDPSFAKHGIMNEITRSRIANMSGIDDTDLPYSQMII